MWSGTAATMIKCMASPVPVRVEPDVPLRTQFGFGRIVCAVNDCRCSQEAVHQATQLLGPGDTLSFIAVAMRMA